MPPSEVRTRQIENTVIVIGGGFAGAFTAWELVKKGFRVLHIDKDSDILGSSSSSFNECYKLHTGLHYLGDPETARQCLLGSIEFAREFPEFIEGNINDPWRKGRHYIVSNSLYEHEALCAELQKLYQEKVEKDERNAVFGDPKDFIKFLKPEDYPYVAKDIPYINEGYSLDVMYEIKPDDIHVKPHKIYIYLIKDQIRYKAINKSGVVEENFIDAAELGDSAAIIKDILRSQGAKELTAEQKKLILLCTSNQNPLFSDKGTVENIHVKVGIETPESQINIDKLRNHLKEEFKKYPNYTFLPNNKVTNISFDAGTLNYKVDSLDSNGEHTAHISAGVVNCTWHNIEELDRKIGYVAKDETTITLPSGEKQTIKTNRIIRPKVSLVVKLPQSLLNVNTCIFSCGPHMSFTNLGNGTAVITYETVTNVGSYPAGTVILSDELRDLYKEKLVPDSGKGKEFSEKIIEGAAYYLPELKHQDCMVNEVRLGHVKIFVKNGQNYSLTDRDSAIHGRKEDGIEQKGLCYISHSGMKMTYTKKGAERVASTLKSHFFTREKLIERREKALSAPPSLNNSFEHKKIPNFYNFIVYNIFRNLTVETSREICAVTFAKETPATASIVEKIDDDTRNDIITGIKKKFAVVQEIDTISSKITDLNDHLTPSKIKASLSTPA